MALTFLLPVQQDRGSKMDCYSQEQGSLFTPALERGFLSGRNKTFIFLFLPLLPDTEAVPGRWNRVSTLVWLL